MAKRILKDINIHIKDVYHKKSLRSKLIMYIHLMAKDKGEYKFRVRVVPSACSDGRDE
jgi:hypothetical protein